MHSQTCPPRRALLAIYLALLMAGCGGGKSEIVAASSEERGLLELSHAYRGFAQRNNRAPKSLEDLNIKGQQFPVAVELIKNGTLVVGWGAMPSPNVDPGGAILAYVKLVPEQGGSVLLQDCKTIKMLTVDEFKAAAKASGN